MMNHKIVIVILVALLLTSCTVDPRKEAEAEKIRLEAQAAKNLADEQLQATKNLNEFNRLDAQREQAIKDAAIADAMVARKRFIQWASFIGAVCLCILILSFTYQSVLGMQGMRVAADRAAIIKASLIYLDAKTGTFPLITQHVHGTRYAIHNPNDHSVILLDTTNPGDAQKIAILGQVQVAGVLAQYAAKSDDPAGISIIQPTIVEAKAPPNIINEKGEPSDER